MDYMIISMRVTFCMSMKDMGDLSLPTHDLFWANLKVQLRLPPLRSLWKPANCELLGVL